MAIQAGDLTGQTGMIVTRTDSGIDELQDLEGKSWAVSDTSSLAHFHYFEALFEDENFDAGEIIEVQGDSSAMLSVFSGEADFASASFLPPIMPFEERLWEHGVDSPDPSRFLGIPPVRSPLGYLLVNGEPQDGGYRLRDARSRVFDVEPEIYDQTQILMVGAQLPNETVVFGRDFPLGLSRDIMTYLQTFVASRQCGASICSSDFYGWTGLEPANDEMFEPIRTIQEALDISDAEMLELAN